MPGTPRAEGNFLRGESARFGIIVPSEFLTFACMHERTHATFLLTL